MILPQEMLDFFHEVLCGVHSVENSSWRDTFLRRRGAVEKD